ncbi:MAG TPA: site-specific DNA-methyltransferase, partial [Chthoniobacterales bacterium]|nr:site-specific DNA-methyltransferase [Chthoniobacterales bacterium]
MTKFELHPADCLIGMSQLGTGCVDLVVTSPPYNLGIAYARYSDTEDRASYLRWCHDWATEVRRLLKPSGSFFLNVGAVPSNPMFPHELVLALRDLFVLQNTIHWIKSISLEEGDGIFISRGHFK